MSRIAGLFAPFGAPALTTGHEAMLDALRFGPAWVSRAATTPGGRLGWTGPRRPGFAHDETAVVVFDGRIYNADELGDAPADAALILALYRRYGFEAATARLNGDFALALYDLGTGTLWLARDRFGVKPLYYATLPDGFAFASQPRALLTVHGVSSALNDRYVALYAASHYRTFDNDPAASPYAGIAQLPAAHWLRYRDGRVTTGRYWTLEPADLEAGSVDELAEAYRALLLDAVARRVRGADRPAFSLSGGMDSSSVLAAAVHATGEKQTAFSSVYEDKTYDESDDIRTMLAEKVSRWYPIRIGTPDVLELVRELVALHDEPVATATWLSHALLCHAAAAEGFGTLFGGLGGDEINAGEYEYFFFHFADLKQDGRDHRLAREIDAWVRHHDHPVFKKSRAVAEEGLHRLVDLDRPGVCRPDRRRQARYAAVLHPDRLDLEAFEPVMDHPFDSYLLNRTYQDIVRETAPCCMRAEDRQTTAAGLDHAMPFYDHRLVSFMFAVPGDLKIHDGVTKYLLRQATRGLLPEATRTRIKKTGWNAPAHAWFSGPGKEAVLDLVRSQAFRERAIYKADEVERLVHEHDRIVASGLPAENHMMFIWQVVNLELWLRHVEETACAAPV